jgi:DNA-binding transcriptional MocR family regulator
VRCGSYKFLEAAAPRLWRRVVATAISIHMNGETRQAWPSHSRLAEMCAADKRTIERATKELESRKHLRVSRKANCANRYEMAKLPVEMQGVPAKMSAPTGENAKVPVKMGVEPLKNL